MSYQERSETTTPVIFAGRVIDGKAWRPTSPTPNTSNSLMRNGDFAQWQSYCVIISHGMVYVLSGR